MSSQYDFQAGFDISGLASVTQTQLMQMVNQIAPLTNIGGVIIMSGASSAHPDVTNNPRFARYIWIDNQDTDVPVLKLYDGSGDTYAAWVSGTVADGSITTAKLAQYAVTLLASDEASTNVAYRHDAAADVTKANYLLRLDSNGRYVEIASLATVMTNYQLLPNQIAVGSASDGQVLMYTTAAGVAGWATLAVSSLISAGSITLDKLATGTANYLMRAGSAGVPEFVVNNDLTATLFANHSIRLITLDVTGATTKDRIYFNGTSWVRYTPFYGAGSGTTLPAVSGTSSAAHALGVVPRNFNLLLVANGADNGYATGDALNCSNIFARIAGPLYTPAISVYADATNV